MFPTTTRFKEGVEIVNSIDEKRLALILSRVIVKIDGKRERIFSEKEETQLAEKFDLSTSSLKTLLGVVCFIFERAAFHNANPAKFKSELEKTGLGESQVTSFGTVWSENRANVISKLRDSVGTSQYTLAAIDWRLNIQMSQDTLCRLKLPTSIFEFHIDDRTDPDLVKTENCVVEFGQDELYRFFLQLEKIQDQLDTLR
eukprot:c15484_g1_i1.p1 GENE.c15484_g1_i1~~c15484_g1_i1.p1  ORF type:complete len:207 (+),score=80.92 c15484_g1_i1:23-622(+)